MCTHTYTHARTRTLTDTACRVLHTATATVEGYSAGRCGRRMKLSSRSSRGASHLRSANPHLQHRTAPPAAWDSQAGSAVVTAHAARGHRLTTSRAGQRTPSAVGLGWVGLGWVVVLVCFFVCRLVAMCLWRRIGLHGFSTRVLRAGTCLSRMRRTTSTCSTRKPTVRPARVEALCCVPHNERAEDLQHAVCHMRHASNDMQPASDRMAAT